MPRYDGNKQVPRSHRRRIEMSKRGLIDRSQKDGPRDRSTYTGYAHGIHGVSGDAE